MLIKKCDKCGWECPGDVSTRKCKACGERLKMGYCKDCDHWTDRLDAANRCRECHKIADNKWRERKIAKAEAQYADWLKKIKQIPQPYKSLTEEQWLEACKHFGLCAYCNTRGIDARSMFIDFKEGGRYCAWNVVPACERCENSLRVVPNPFKRMNEYIYRDAYNKTKKLGYSVKNLQRIVDYLEPKMEVNKDEP